jgi:hypothetical protein
MSTTQVADAHSDQPGARPDPAAPGGRWWPVGAIALTAALLVGFVALGRVLPPIPFGFFSHPPIYGFWAPVLDRMALWVIPAGAVLVTVGWAFTALRTYRRFPAWLGLGLLVACGVAVAATVALVRGDDALLYRGVSTAGDSPYYTSDLDLVERYGPRGFAERHPELMDQFHSYSSRTHPPGVHLLLYALFRVIGEHPLRITTVLAVLSLSAALAAWLMGRTIGGSRAGRISAVLFVTAPGPLLLAYTSLDAVFATLLAGGAALFMLAIARRSAPVAAAAGAVLGAGTLMTYATVFIALAATVAVIVDTRRVREAARLLGAAAAGGVPVLLLGRLALGIDVVASYRASPPSGGDYLVYWVFGGPAAWLIFAGLPLAALGLAGLVRKVPGARRATLPLVLVGIMLVWAMLPAELTNLRPGEVERTWAFLYPVLAASAGPVVDRWTRSAGEGAGSARVGRGGAGTFGSWGSAIVPALAVLGIAQAVLLQALWDNLF